MSPLSSAALASVRIATGARAAGTQASVIHRGEQRSSPGLLQTSAKTKSRAATSKGVESAAGASKPSTERVVPQPSASRSSPGIASVLLAANGGEVALH